MPGTQVSSASLLSSTQPSGGLTQTLSVLSSYKRIGVALLRDILEGLPWWLSGKESAYQRRSHRSNPWSRKIPHATEQLSLVATATESGLCGPGPATAEARTPESPHSATSETPTMETLAPQLESNPWRSPEQPQRPNTAKNK